MGTSEKTVGTEVNIVGAPVLVIEGIAVELSVVGSAVGLSVGLSVKVIVGLSTGGCEGETELSKGADEGDKTLLGLKETEGEVVVCSVSEGDREGFAEKRLVGSIVGVFVGV